MAPILAKFTSPEVMAMFPSTSISLLALLLLFLHLSLLTAAKPLYSSCGTSSNFTANSTYQSNLDVLLSALASNGSASGFTKATVGQVPEQVYGLVLCRGDVNATECRSCIDEAGTEARQRCPYNKAAEIRYDYCLLRFSNEQFLSSIDNSVMLHMWNTNNATQLDRFNDLVYLLLNSTVDLAANSSKRFATAEISNYMSEFPTIYGLMQCTPDMSASDCRQCLLSLFIPQLPDSLKGKRGGRVVGLRCNMRYETYSFYQGTSTLKLTAPLPSENATNPATAPVPPPLANPAGPGEDGGKKNMTGIILAIVVPTIAALLLLIFIIYICFRRRRKLTPRYETEPEKISNIKSILFDLPTIRVATGNFAEENKLGEGGFGAVYKGLLPNGQEIAVKKLSNSGIGLGELKNELILVAKLQHRNLVKLIGVCLEREKMIVYEYVPNRSLDTFLFDPVRSIHLNWGARYNIIKGIARGLLYLHEESQHKIIHRDLKASNVLLDTDMNPKIADFGIAKLFHDEQTQGATNRVVGTFGYMAPEYAMHGIFSLKSDVYSYGVLVLEILTGRKNGGSNSSESFEELLNYTWENWNRGTALAIVDPAMGGNYQGSINVLKCIQLGLLCVQENPVDRPTMRMVDLMLNSETVSLQPPSRPAFFVGGSYSNNLGSAVGVASERGNKSPNNDVTISDLDPR